MVEVGDSVTLGLKVVYYVGKLTVNINSGPLCVSPTRTSSDVREGQSFVTG